MAIFRSLVWLTYLVNIVALIIFTITNNNSMKAFSTLIIFALTISILLSCKDPDAALRKELDATIFKMDMMERQLASSQTAKAGDLVHIVFLNVRDNLSETEYAKFIEELNQLQGIPNVRSFTLGDRKDLDDPRQIGEYEIVMSMAFDDEVGYQTYQDHPKHVALKKVLESFLDGAPAVYDYIKM